MIWATIERQKSQMVDRDCDKRGNQAVRQDHTDRWLVRQLSEQRPIPVGAETLHLQYIAICSAPPLLGQATRWRMSVGRDCVCVRAVRWQR